MKRILLLINPRARSAAERSQELIASIKDAGHQIQELSLDEQKADFKELILKYQTQVDVVVVAGGDGTLNFVLPSLVQTKLPLLVFPLGTANLLARSFNIRPDINQLLQLLEQGEKVPIDLGMVNGIYFINVCGLGISTEVNQRVSRKLKKLTGPFSFWLTGFKLRKRLRPFKLTISADGQTPLTTKTWQLTVCNGRKYAAWMTIEPRASYDDGTLHCLSTEIKKWWQGFKLLPSYIKGNYREDLDVSFIEGKQIRVDAKKPLSIDVDGDVQTCTPAVFEVASRVLNLIVPQEALRDSSPISAPGL